MERRRNLKVRLAVERAVAIWFKRRRPPLTFMFGTACYAKSCACLFLSVSHCKSGQECRCYRDISYSDNRLKAQFWPFPNHLSIKVIPSSDRKYVTVTHSQHCHSIQNALYSQSLWLIPMIHDLQAFHFTNFTPQMLLPFLHMVAKLLNC